MPHVHIEYSANLEPVIDFGQLCDVIRAKAVEIPAFPLAGVRVRATRVDHYSIADGNSKHGFIDLSIRLREGRAHDVRKSAVNEIFETLKTCVGPVLKNHSIALSAEIREINADLSPKYGTIRDHLGDSQ